MFTELGVLYAKYKVEIMGSEIIFTRPCIFH
jgi:hypothetical protein